MQKSNLPPTINPSTRVGRVEEYYFSTKLKEIAAMNAAGKAVINLGIGSPDLPPSEETIATLCREAQAADVHGYQPYTGIPSLREAYASWYQRWYDVSLNPAKEVLPLIGSKEGILHISMAFLNPGDGVLIPNPGYPTYQSVSKLVDARIIPYDLKAENGWFPSFDQLEAMDLKGVKLMWVNYPNMPTGADATPALYKRLIDFGQRHNILICNDNPYSFILNDKPLSIISFPGAKEVCLELNSLSKSHNMPGWRMAMLIGNEKFISWTLKIKSNVDSGQFKPMQLAAIEALNAPKAWHEEMNIIYRNRRIMAERIMLAIGCTFQEDQKGLFLWGKIIDPAMDAETLCDSILKEANVFITPGFIFGTQGKQYVRISLCSNEEQLNKALERVEHKF